MVVDYKTKSDAAYDMIRSDIMDGKLKPGQKVVASSLSKAFGFSVIPIREAITRLESEGFLQVESHVGAVVTKYDPSETKEIFRVRVELECIAAKWAVALISDAEINFLEKLIVQMDGALKKGDYRELSALNKDFHLKTYQACGCSFLYTLIVELWEKVHVRNDYAFTPERAPVSVSEHKAMLKAIKGKDTDLIDALLRDHKKNSFLKLIDNLKQMGN